MRIQHNIMAMNAYRNYNNNTSALSKNLEKLSSGYKINRAGDDAAGLAISEKMRAQITGLDVAQKNAKDGISLVQTAEGALTEVHDMLNRMYELAEQSANGIYEDGTDRAQLQKEVVELRTEINRIADSANFNGIKLLDGTQAGGGAAGKAAAGTEVVMGMTGTWGGATKTATDVQAAAAKYSFTLTGKGQTDVNGKKIDGVEIKWNTDLDTSMRDFLAEYNADDTKEYTATYAVGKLTLTAKETGAKTAPATDIASVTANEDVAGVAASSKIDLSANPQAGDEITIDGKKYTFNATADGADGKTFKDLATLKTAAKKNGVELDITTKTAVTATKQKAGGGGAGGLTLQIGDTAEDFNKITVSIASCKADDIGVGAIDIGSQTGAADAMAEIKEAINYVSNVRGGLGATQNRLDHTINNLSVMRENIQDAEATIRDTDVANEMMAYTKNNILIQSAQAMLAQANQVPQGVLQLLQ